MPTLGWKKLDLFKGILREPSLDENRLIVWIPEAIGGKAQSWERVSNVAGAEISENRGVYSTAAVSIRACPKKTGLIGGLIRRFRQQSESQTWILPNGQEAEQIGTRWTDLLLAWSDETTALLDEAQIKSLWPQCQEIKKIAANLFLVRGAELQSRIDQLEPPAITQETAVQLAEEMLATARRAQDRRREIVAMTDLGIVFTRIGETDRAVSLLEEALALVRPIGDRLLESDVLENLGLALLQAGEPQRSLDLLKPVLEYARTAGDRFAEKMAFFHLGLAYSAMRDFNRSREHLDHALAVARQFNDPQGEAELLWRLAVINAETGHNDQAVSRAEEAMTLYKEGGNPQVAWLKTNLEKYRAGLISVPVGSQSELSSPPIFGGQIITGGWSGVQPSQGQRASGPGLLRMAFSAMTSIAHFTRAGFKPAPSETYRHRLQTCGQCEHHTGLRCKLCGCFTKVKAWMPHETCPIGKWR